MKGQPMKTEREFPRFTVTAKGARWVEQGHPWIYAAEIRGAPDASVSPFDSVLSPASTQTLER